MPRKEACHVQEEKSAYARMLRYTWIGRSQETFRPDDSINTNEQNRFWGVAELCLTNKSASTAPQTEGHLARQTKTVSQLIVTVTDCCHHSSTILSPYSAPPCLVKDCQTFLEVWVNLTGAIDATNNQEADKIYTNSIHALGQRLMHIFIHPRPAAEASHTRSSFPTHLIMDHLPILLTRVFGQISASMLELENTGNICE